MELYLAKIRRVTINIQNEKFEASNAYKGFLVDSKLQLLYEGQIIFLLIFI